VQLEPQDALERLAAGIIVHDLAGELIIHAQSDFRADARQVVFVPFLQPKPSRLFGRVSLTRFARAFRIKDCSLAAHRKGVTAKFFIESDEPGGLKIVIHLITANVVVG